MATKFSHARLVFFVPLEGALADEDDNGIAYAKFKGALRKNKDFEELEFDEDDNGKEGYLVVFGVENPSTGIIKDIIKRIDKCIPK